MRARQVLEVDELVIAILSRALACVVAETVLDTDDNPVVSSGRLDAAPGVRMNRYLEREGEREREGEKHTTGL